MERRYAISDIHGNARAFLGLLDYVDPDPEELVILGDLVDYGLESWDVLEECSILMDEGAVVLKGNHDHYFHQFFLDEKKGAVRQHYHYLSAEAGGITTAKSIQIARQKYGDDEVNNTITRIFQNMKLYHETDECIFVHAGIDPRIPWMDQQKPDVLMESCAAWKDPHAEHTFEEFVVFGHTPTFKIHKEITLDDCRVWSSNRARKIGINTGADFGGRLTMMDLYEGIAYAYDIKTREIITYKARRGMK